MTWQERAVAGLQQPQQFVCPRCHQTVTQRLYGPCGTCVAQLRAKADAGAADIKARAVQAAAEREEQMWREIEVDRAFEAGRQPLRR